MKKTRIPIDSILSAVYHKIQDWRGVNGYANPSKVVIPKDWYLMLLKPETLFNVPVEIGEVLDVS